jgi:hypothetical protein
MKPHRFFPSLQASLRRCFAPVFRVLMLALLAFARTGESLAQSAEEAANQAANQAAAQLPADSGPAMASGLRADGKIWVVVGVILIILLGLLAYLISLDRRIGKAEAQLCEDPPSPRT